jgi:membrane protease YdiL (CAAX protease family)
VPGDRTDPRTRPGANPGTQPVADPSPRTQPSANPGSGPPSGPGPAPARGPNSGPGPAPGPNPGFGPAPGPNPASNPAAAPGPGPTRPAWALPAALAAMAIVYPAAFVFRVVPFWSAMVAFSAFSWWAAWHPYFRTRLRPSRRLVAMGVLSGVALYLLFVVGALVVRETPLWRLVESVVGLTRSTAPGALAALVIVFGTSPSEEVLWRGAVFARMTRRYGGGWPPVVATTLLYALFAGLSGTLVLPLAALVCGAVWARQRQVTGSIVPGLVSHALWSLLMFLYVPGVNGP